MLILGAFGASLLVGVVFAAGPCGLGLHRKPDFVSKRNAGWECVRCRRVQFNLKEKS
jgi:hypothetical protein